MNTARQVLLIYNAAAGKRRVAQELEPIITGLTRAGCLVTACPVGEGPGAPELLAAYPDRFDAVVCCGGDGTLHYTVNDVMTLPRPLPVGYLPFGSTNDFAASAGLRRPLEENCAGIGRFAPQALDLGRFNERHFCYVAAFGMFTAVSYQTPQATKNLLGHFAYVLEGVLRLDLSQGWKATIQVDDETLEGEFWYCSVSNSRYIGGMAVPEQSAVKLDDGSFEVMILRKPQTLPQARRLVTCLMSQKPDGELLYLLQAKRVRAVFDEPTGWTLDGEASPQVTEADIRVEPGRLELLV